jgi:hypothetical protein
MLRQRGAGASTIREANMTTRSVGPGAGFGWLSQGISAAFNHPKSLFGGAALLLVVLLLPSLITVPMQFHFMREGTPPSTTTTLLIMAISMLFGLLIIPLYAGYLQMVDAAEREEAVRASDIFKPYRQGKAWQLIGLGVAHLVIYIAGMAVIILATGGGIAGWYMQVLAAQANHEVPPGVPGGFWVAFALLVVFGLLMMGFYAISLGQVALNRRSVFGAIGDGVSGALKNVLPLFVFALVSILGLDCLCHRDSDRGACTRIHRQAHQPLADVHRARAVVHRHDPVDDHNNVRRDVPPVARCVRRRCRVRNATAVRRLIFSSAANNEGGHGRLHCFISKQLNGSGQPASTCATSPMAAPSARSDSNRFSAPDTARIA